MQSTREALLKGETFYVVNYINEERTARQSDGASFGAFCSFFAAKEAIKDYVRLHPNSLKDQDFVVVEMRGKALFTKKQPAIKVIEL